MEQQLELLQAKLQASRRAQGSQAKGSGANKTSRSSAQISRKGKGSAKKGEHAPATAPPPTELATVVGRSVVGGTSPPWRVFQASVKAQAASDPPAQPEARTLHGSIATVAAATIAGDSAGAAAGTSSDLGSAAKVAAPPPEKDMHAALHEKEMARCEQSPTSASTSEDS